MSRLLACLLFWFFGLFPFLNLSMVLILNVPQSRVRQSILKEDTEPHPFGVSTFRFVVSSSAIEKDPVARTFIEKDGHLTVWADQDGRKFITYPCR